MLNSNPAHPSVQEELVSNVSYPISKGKDWALSIMTRVDEVVTASETSVMVQVFLDLMIEVAQADSAYFFQLNATEDELVITHVCGDAESQFLVGLSLNRHQGLPGISLCNAKITVIGDLPSDPDWLSLGDPENAARKKNVINLPVANKDHTLGVVQIFNFHQAELDMLLALSRRLALEMDRRREMEAVQWSNQRLLTLVNVLGEVAGTLDRNHLLNLVTENAARLVGAERSSLFLVDPETSEMIYQVAYQPQDHEQTPSSADHLDKGVINSRDKYDYFTRQADPDHSQKDDFWYFNRHAITVPLQSKPISRNRAEEHTHVFGGLMALNKSDASFHEEDAQLMRILADQASTFLQVVEMYESTGELFLGVIKSLTAAIDAYDPYTQGHSQHVSDYSVLIARELGFDENFVNDLRIGSLLHDIGKIGIPDSILLKQGALSAEEMEVMREHPCTGVNILSQVKLLEPMCPAILEHHERLDGSGYPAKMTDKEISWMGRIVAVADVFDAMTSNRPYRQALRSQEVLEYLDQRASIQFDASCVQALHHIINRLN